MNSLARKTLFVAVVWLAVVPTIAHAQARSTTKAERWLSKTIIPPVDFHDADLNDVIRTLQDKCTRADARRRPGHYGYSFSVLVKRRPSEESAATPISTTPPMPRITLSLPRTSVLKALKKVAAYAGLKVMIVRSGVVFAPWDQCTDPLITVAFRTPPKFIGLPDECGEIPAEGANDNSAAAYIDARPILESCGMTFPPGASAVYWPHFHKLTLRNTQNNLELVEDIPRFDDQ